LALQHFGGLLVDLNAYHGLPSFSLYHLHCPLTKLPVPLSFHKDDCWNRVAAIQNLSSPNWRFSISGCGLGNG
jgi:hypothetical protein